MLRIYLNQSIRYWVCSDVAFVWPAAQVWKTHYRFSFSSLHNSFSSASQHRLSKNWRGGEKIWWKASFHCFSKLYCSLLILQASLYFLRYRFTFWDPPMPKFTDLSTCDVMVIWQSTQWKKAKYLLIQYSFWLLMLTTLQSPFTFPFVLDRSLCEHTVLAYSSCLF